MKIIISIKPEYTEKILNGEKQYEFRKRFSNKKITKAIIYESAPVSRVVGEFGIEKVLNEPLNILWIKTKMGSGINKEYFDKYFLGKEYGYALKIKNPKRYKINKSIIDYGKKFPPQSYYFI